MMAKMRLALKSLFSANLKYNTTTFNYLNHSISRDVSTAFPLFKSEDRRTLIASSPAKDEGTEGEKSFNIDNLINS